jgi:transposase
MPASALFSMEMRSKAAIQVERRRKAARLFLAGYKPARIARELGVSIQSAARWHGLFDRGGEAALIRRRKAGPRSKLSSAQMHLLILALRNPPPAYQTLRQRRRWTQTVLQTYLKERFSVKFNRSYCRKLFLSISVRHPTYSQQQGRVE